MKDFRKGDALIRLCFLKMFPLLVRKTDEGEESLEQGIMSS